MAIKKHPGLLPFESPQAGIESPATALCLIPGLSGYNRLSNCCKIKQKYRHPVSLERTE